MHTPHRSLLLPSTLPAPPIRSGSRSRAILLAPHPFSVVQTSASLPPSSSRSRRSHPRPRAPKHPRRLLPTVWPAHVPPRVPHTRTDGRAAAVVLASFWRIWPRPLSSALAAPAPAPPSPRLVRSLRTGSCRLSRLFPRACSPASASLTHRKPHRRPSAPAHAPISGGCVGAGSGCPLAP